MKLDHNLVALAERLNKHGVTLSVDADDLARPNPCTVVFSYDDSEIETIGRDETLKVVEQIRARAAALIPTPPLEQ